MKVEIRKFERSDISRKVEWINNPENNRFLHYDLPLEQRKTETWYDNNKERHDRFDAVIVADEIPCGIIGLLEIDKKNGKAEYYITMGNVDFKKKGVATIASKLILKYAFEKLNLNKVYLYTEVDNILAQRLFEKIGFVKEGCLTEDLFSRGRFVDRYVYGILRKNFVLEK